MSLAARLQRRLKLRDLDTLRAVVQYGSMAKAAANLAVSQPAVSKAIADMEHLLGVRLLDRTARGVEPTVYGEALLKRANAVFDEVRQGVNEIEFLANPTVGELRIGAAGPMLGGFLAAVVADLHRRHPGIAFEVWQQQSLADQRRDLRERNVDMIIGRVLRRETEDDLTTEILFEEPWLVVSGAQNPLARRRKLALADLLDEPWTLPRPDSVIGADLADAFRAAGLELPRSAMTCASIQMHTALMVSSGFLAIFPRSLLRFGVEQALIKVLPVELPGLPPPVGITTLKARSLNPVARLFIERAHALAIPSATDGRKGRSKAQGVRAKRRELQRNSA